MTKRHPAFGTDGRRNPPWWGKEDPKERARRLWKKTAPWNISPGKCYRQGESGPDEGPPELNVYAGADFGSQPSFAVFNEVGRGPSR